MASLTPTYYSTWTSLHHHVWTAQPEPPTCPHASCSEGTFKFASHHGLRAPLKLHDEREVGAAQNEVDGEMVKETRERRDQRSDGGDGEWEGIGSARYKGEVKTSNR